MGPGLYPNIAVTYRDILTPQSCLFFLYEAGFIERLLAFGELFGEIEGTCYVLEGIRCSISGERDL